MFYIYRILLVTGVIFSNMAQAAQIFSLAEAERLALELDPGSKRFQSIAQSLHERSVADGQLPDPQIKFGLNNFPVDTFKRDQEPMTQIQIGVQQMLPRGDSLHIKSRQTVSQARSNEYRAQERQLSIRKQVRLAWLEMYYWSRAKEVVQKNRKLFEQLVEVSQYHYATGRRNQQDVIRAQLELSKLDDRLLDISSRLEKNRAELAVLIGREPSSVILPDALPGLKVSANLKGLDSALLKHPRIMIAKSQIENSKHGVALSREAYKPGWMLGVTYGIRDGQNPNGSERPDFASVGVTVDIPLFRAKRQDRRLAASQFELGASKQNLDQQYLDLKNMLEKEFSDWLRLKERLRFYRDVLLSQARQNTESSLSAYQNDRSDFATLMRARITELDAELKFIRINVSRSKSQARLLYLSGEEK